jgi:hypothetical protein
MDTVSVEPFLLDQVPAIHRALFAPTLKRAYDAAAVVIKNEPIFQTPSAIDNAGRIRSWAVDRAFQTLIDSGQWPADYRWTDFAKPTGRYLEIRLSHFSNDH